MAAPIASLRRGVESSAPGVYTHLAGRSPAVLETLVLQFVKELNTPSNTRVDAVAGVRSFLITRGFREDRREPGALKFQRSSQLATLFAFDPSRWRIDLRIEPAGRSVKMMVHTDGQVVTPRERLYFKAFFDEVLAVMSHPGKTSTAMALWGDQTISHRAARAALNENVAVMFGFFFSFPTLIVLLHAAVSVPMIWAICWGFGGSIAIAYACLFSVKNRASSRPQ